MSTEGPLSTETVFCYAAAKTGMPGFFAVAVDRPEYKKETAKDVAKWVRDGYAVSRVPLAEAQSGLNKYLAARKAKADAT